jgi:2-polyprenyl-3-methyl-5-hydroxy-6-metoxy-1,4-benzoquinol methylase
VTTPTQCFEALADDACWLTFSAEERRKVDAFFERWQIRPGDRILEPGCGSGRLTALLADRVGPEGRVMAFDASAAFIQRAIERRLPAQVSLHLVRAELATIDEGTFDHVICFNVFPHLVPHASIAARLATALRPGGVFWIAHTCSRTFVNDIHRRGPACIHDHLLPAPEELAALVGAAGLVDIEIHDGEDRFLARAVRR